MTAVISIKPLATLLAPLLFALLVMINRHARVWKIGNLLAALTQLAVTCAMLPAVLHGKLLGYPCFSLLPNLHLRFVVDAPGLLLALTLAGVWVVTALYSAGFMRHETALDHPRFFYCSALSVAVTTGIAFAGNLLTLYLLYLVLILTIFPLLRPQTDLSPPLAVRWYLISMVLPATFLLLPALIFIFQATGRVSFESLAMAADTLPPLWAIGLCACFLFGFAKAGLFPLHGWLPATMSTPAPIAALLHTAIIGNVGVFCIIRTMTRGLGPAFFTLPHIATGTAMVASLSLLITAGLAYAEEDLQRRLAYAGASQMAFIILSMCLTSPKGLVGSLAHIALNVPGFCLLYMCAGAITVRTAAVRMSQMTGLGRQMPITMACFLIGALNVIGLPPCGGFISKWYMLLAALEAQQFVIFSVLLLGGVLTAALFLPVIYNAFFCPAGQSLFKDHIREAPLLMLVPMIMTAFICLVSFFAPEPFQRLALLTVS